MDVRRGLRSTCLVWSVALLCACGGDEEVFDLRDANYPDDAPYDAGDGGDAGRRDASAGMDASSDAGDGSIDIDASTDLDANLSDADTSDAGDGGKVETAPEVKVLSPVGSVDPADNLVITGSTVAVSCYARSRQSGGIRAVTIDVYDSTNKDTPKVTFSGLYEPDGGYGNTMVSLANVASGRIRIRCTAVDNVTDAQTGWDEIETLYDGGPVVTFDNPLNGDVIPRGGNNPTSFFNIRFRVAPARLRLPAADAGASDQDAAALDPGADITSVALVINDLPWTKPLVLTNGVYSADLNFWTFFNKVPVDKAAFEVVAKNARGITVKTKINVQVDGVGPDVSITTPPRLGDMPPFVGGLVELRATASDALAGLGTSSAKVTTPDAPGGARNFPLTEYSPGVIGFDFDVNSFPNVGKVVAQIDVYDKVGNLTQVSHTMIIDNVGPWVSLDPPNIRVELASTIKCSGSFDPLAITPVDGQVIEQQARFRAMVYERATFVPGATEQYFSGIRSGSVAFVAQPYGAATDPSSGRQLLVNRDDDPDCDIVDDSPVTSGQLAPFRVPFRPVPTGGTSPDAEGAMFSAAPLPASNQCGGGPNVMGTVIPPRCSGNDMTYVLGHPSDGSPAVYGYEPGAGIACTGTSLDFGGPPGWYCVTTVARDMSGSEGNLSIAEPLRVCRWLKAGDCGPGVVPGMIVTPPADLKCTDGCTLPTVWKTPAMPRIVPAP